MSVAAMARNALSKRRIRLRARLVVPTAAVLGVLAVRTFGLVGIGGTAVAVRAAMADPLSILSARSPGAREPGALHQTKPAHGQSFARRPGVRPPVPGSVPPDPYVPGAPAAFVPIEGSFPPAVGVAVPFVPVLGSSDAVSVFPGGPVGGFPGGGLPGGGGFFPVTPVIPPVGGGGDVVTPPVVTPVPEPATWMSMIVGFGMVGWTMRRRTRRDAGTA